MADEEGQQTDAPLQSDQEQVKEDPSDKLTPEHPRFKEVYDRAKKAEERNSELEKRVEELEKLGDKISQRQEDTGSDELTLDELKELDRLDKLYFKSKGYLTKEDLLVERRADEYRRLEDKYDGSNGLPKFDAVEVETYAKRNGFGSNYEAAYKDMHHQAIVQLEAKKLAGETITPPTQEKASGGEREQAETEFTPEAIANMTPEEYEKNRDKIKASLKASILT